MKLQDVIDRIQPVDGQAYAQCLSNFDRIAKPVGSLGKLETLLARVAAITGTAEVDVSKKCVLVFCADNGVLAQGVAQSHYDVTTAIARSLAAGTASVNAMAKAAGADVFSVDMGMIDTVPQVRNEKVAHGTADITQGPAMSRQQAERAVLTGLRLVGEKKTAGYQVIATGEAGIGNTTTSSAMASVLLHMPVDQVTGRGSGLTDAGLERKRRAIETAIAVNRPDPEDPLGVLSQLGGFDIAAMTGAFLGGAFYGVPLVVDGLISAVAALCAVRLCPLVREYLLASHLTAEPAGAKIMEALKLEPILYGGLRLGEGTGAVALFPMLDMAQAVYCHAATFEQISVAQYERLS